MASLIAQEELESTVSALLSDLNNKNSTSNETSQQMRNQTELESKSDELLRQLGNVSAEKINTQAQKPFLDPEKKHQVTGSGALSTTLPPSVTSVTEKNKNENSEDISNSVDELQMKGNYAKEHSIIVNNIIGETGKGSGSSMQIELNWQIALLSCFCVFLVLIVSLGKR